MKEAFPTPDYDHDPEQYAAACRWLGYTPLTFGRTPLPEFLYQNIAEDMVKGDKGWAFNTEEAARSFLRAAKVESEGFPATAFEQYLKHLYRGMFAACKTGCDQMPSHLAIIQHRDSSNPLHTGIHMDPVRGPMLGFYPNLADKLRDARFNPIAAEDIGFKLQCYTHYVKTHESELRNTAFGTDAAAFVNEQCDLRRARHIAMN